MIMHTISAADQPGVVAWYDRPCEFLLQSRAHDGVREGRIQQSRTCLPFSSQAPPCHSPHRRLPAILLAGVSMPFSSQASPCHSPRGRLPAILLAGSFVSCGSLLLSLVLPSHTTPQYHHRAQPVPWPRQHSQALRPPCCWRPAAGRQWPSPRSSSRWGSGGVCGWRGDGAAAARLGEGIRVLGRRECGSCQVLGRREEGMLPCAYAPGTSLTRPRCAYVPPMAYPQNDQFMQDGAPVQLRAGCIHYSRVPLEYWEDRLLRLRAMGLNSVQTYVPWNWHQPSQNGPVDFTGYACACVCARVCMSACVCVHASRVTNTSCAHRCA